MEPQLSLGLEAKRTNLARVLEHAGYDWQMLARLVVRTMHGQFVTGEDLRLRCLELQIIPHKPNAWGAFVSLLIREGKLIPTGKRTPRKAVKSHARKTDLYRVESHP